MMLSTNILAQRITTVGTDEKLEFARWSSGNALLIGGLLAAAGLYAVAWMYRREARGQVGPALRWTLVACRAAVLLLLGVIGLEPVIVDYVHRRLESYTLVLVDKSASMSLADQYRHPTDAQRIESVVGDIPAGGLERDAICGDLLQSDGRRWLRALAAKNAVKVFSFANGLSVRELIPRSETHADAGEQPDAGRATAATRPHADEAANENGDDGTIARMDLSATDVGMAIRGAIESVGGAPVAGVVLLTDGGFNRGEASGVVARYLKQRRVGAFVVGVGDPAEPVNVGIEQISAPRTAFKNDPFSVTVHIESEGTGDEAVRVELFEQIADTAAESVEVRTVRPDAEGRFEPLVFERTVAAPGAVGYVARIAPLPYEAVTADNERAVMPAVRVLDDKMKILLVAGSPSYDYRFLARMLERDATVELSTWLQSADERAVRDGDATITELPTTLENVNKYDAILLMDCDPRGFGPTWADVLAAYVSDHGGGLLYAAGNKYAGQFFRTPTLKPILEILPIVPDPEAELLINELGHYQRKAWPILIPDEAATDPVLRQGHNAADTKLIWSVLGKVFWHYPVRREKPVARALMRHADPRRVNTFGPHVLLATQFVGTGRTAFLGINSTWRWRRFDEKPFNRFWIQMLRYLVEGKLLGGRARGQILTAKDRYDVHESIAVTVRALDEHFDPLVLPELELTVARQSRAGDDGNEAAAETLLVGLAPIPGRDGHYAGRFVPNQIGSWRLSLRLPGGVSPTGDDRDRSILKEIRVSQSDIELRSPALNRAGLRQFVEAAAGGSHYFDIDQANQAPNLIPDCSRTSVHRERPRPVWDNTIVLSILIGLLTIEWILRKKAKLL